MQLSRQCVEKETWIPISHRITTMNAQKLLQNFAFESSKITLKNCLKFLPLTAKLILKNKKLVSDVILNFLLQKMLRDGEERTTKT